MLKIVYTTSARADLIEAWMFVAEDSPSAADQMLDTINEGIHLLAQQPLLGRERPELRVGLRSWPTSTPYVLYYIPSSESLTLIRVLHHARDIQNIEMH
ncbi:MAG: type II toxin-antitoxin system RelE/ParE family toxin [Proteobacteria bacterium]|nr:type II toxin-antitoxin system RelE/ParE family toxin [Pseudomonadota bacterium]